MTEETKKIIDGMSYCDMLYRWRFALSGDRFFTGEVGDYFAKSMKIKKEALPDGEAVRISKEIGWDK